MSLQQRLPDLSTQLQLALKFPLLLLPAEARLPSLLGGRVVARSDASGDGRKGGGEVGERSRGALMVETCGERGRGKGEVGAGHEAKGGKGSYEGLRARGVSEVGKAQEPAGLEEGNVNWRVEWVSKGLQSLTEVECVGWELRRSTSEEGRC
jgi:hypothetical protein